MKINWDNNADFYNEMAWMELPYTERQIDCLDIGPEDTVLDIGCGPGRISCLAAKRAKAVTSLDASVKMLEHLKENAERMQVSNIRRIHKNWFDVVPGTDVEKHDIVIASRTEAMQDIDKLSSLAKKYAAVMIWANAPSIPEIIGILYQGVQEENGVQGGPPRGRANGYNQFFNKIYNLGYDPNIKILTDGFTRNFAGEKEALDYFWALKPGLPEEKKERLLENLRPYLTKEADGTLTFRFETRTCVIWWKPEKGEVQQPI